MKKIMLAFSPLFFALVLHAQTKLWTGGGDGSSWNDSLNWSPSGIPAVTDDVRLDNTTVPGNYIVHLPSGNVSVTVNSLVITPQAGMSITFQLPVTNIATTAFTATGPGDAVVLNNGAVFINSSGASSGTPVTILGSNFFRINNGGKYIHNTPRGHTTNLASRLSTEAGTENGIFEFDVPDVSYTVSLSNRNYGKLILSSTAKGSHVTYSGNGASPLNINGDFIINEDVTFSIGLTSNMIVHGNFTQAASSTFNLQNSTNSNIVKMQGDINIQGIITENNTGSPVLELNGIVNQNVTVTGTITNNVNFRLNNAAGATLLSPLSISYNLDLLSGNLKTGVTNILTMNDNATVTNASSAGFVEGPMKKIGDDVFSFPVGKGEIYAPISINSPGMATSDAFQAEYFRVNPQSLYGSNFELPLDHVSYVEYWQLDKVSGSTAIPAAITLNISSYSFAKDINTLYVARYNTPDLQWKDEGAAAVTAGTPAPPYITGNVTSSPVNQFGVFTLSTTVSEAMNPLPVGLISFNAVRLQDEKIKIAWQLSDFRSSAVQFSIERSENGNDFNTVQTLVGNPSGKAYIAYDNPVDVEVVKYRLKITNEDGNVSYSAIASIINNRGWVVNLSPNPVSDNAGITINSSAIVNFRFIIYDINGRMIKQWQQVISSGKSRLPLQIAGMGKGIYFLSINDGRMKSVTRFVKL